GGCVVYDLRNLNQTFRHGVNSAKLSSAELKKLLQSRNKSEPPHHDCDLIVGSGFLSITLAEEAISRLTRRLVISYGASEMGTSPLRSRVGVTKDMDWFVPDNRRTIEIVDENGNLCQEGELRILLTEIDCTSYLDDAEASAKMFRNGFFYPGDMAVRRA